MPKSSRRALLATTGGGLAMLAGCLRLDSSEANGTEGPSTTSRESEPNRTGDSSEISGEAGESSVVWETSNDWDDATSSTLNIAHDRLTDRTESSIAQLGYDASGTGLIGYYPLHEDSLSTATELVNGYSATWSSTPDTDTGIFGNTCAYISDGVEAEANSGSHFQGLMPLTVAFWFKPASNLNGGNAKNWTFLNKTEEWNIQNRRNSGDGSKIAMGTWGDRLRTSTNSWSAERWYHLTYVLDVSNNVYEVYVDGTLDNSKNPSTTIDSTTYPLRIGNGKAYTQYKGNIADVRIYNRALSSSEVSELADKSGSLTTATKSFGSSVQPDLATDATLNGQTVDVTVTGSPSGTAESHTISLDGSGSHVINWSESHTDFEVQAQLSTSDVTTTPQVNSIELG